jgi:type I restriction enzyme S subunit
MDTKKLRQKILDLAIHGKLVPQDPNDEPASVLLERIRAEKEMLIKEGKIKAPKKSKSAGDTSHYPKDVPFEVPEGWALSTVIDVFQINPKNHEDDATEAGFVPMTKISDGFEDRFSFELKPWKSIKTGFTHFRNGDIAVAKISPCLENRKSFVVRGLPQEIGAGTTELFIFRSGQIIPEYGLLFFKSEFFISNCVGTFNGVVGQQRVARNTIEEMPFPIPPIREQKRIIQRVGSIFRMVSEVENSQTALKDSIEKSKARILDMAIHGKLVPQDPSEEPAIALLKRINPDFKASDNLHYIECPSGWAVTQMKSIIELLSGRDLENSRCNADGYGVPYLVGASCIDKGRISIYRWTETPEVISKEGDVLLSCKGTVGEVVLNTLGNLHIARQFMAIRSKAPQYILPDYLEILIKASIETLKKAARGIIPGISREDILELTVMIPPFEEQQRILSRIAEFNQSVSLIVANTCN